MEQWDKREREQPKTEIHYLGKCPHIMKKGYCVRCGKTMDEIITKEGKCKHE